MAYQKLLDNMSYSLSDSDLKQLLGNDAKIMKYSQLSDVNSIEQLLPNATFDYVILLVELKDDVGHWECVVRCGKIIFFFDSYGARVDKQLLYAPKQLRKDLDQKYPLLSYLLNKALEDGFHVMFSTYKYQVQNGNINTCGRWCVVFINYMKHSPQKQQNFEDFCGYILNSAKKYQFKDLDMLVTHFTS